MCILWAIHEGRFVICICVSSYYQLQYTYTFDWNRLIGHLQGASSSCVNALFLLDNITPFLDTVNGFQLAVETHVIMISYTVLC